MRNILKKNLQKINSTLSTFHSQLRAAGAARGQAMVALLFFVVMAITITSGAVIVLYSNSLSGTRFQQGSIAYEIAQSGVENAILRLIRDPAYTGETLTVGNGTATTQVTKSGSSYTIISTGTVGNFVKKIQVDGTYTNTLFTEVSRKEIY
jgi:hypothetical protein